LDISYSCKVFPIICSFHAYIQTQFRLSLVALQTDNGREYDSAALRAFFSTHGISLRLSCPYTLQQNSNAERVLRTISDCLRTPLIHSGAAPTFWAEALNTATHLLNRRPMPCHWQPHAARASPWRPA
jgi:transposase InsO family protein